MSSPNSSRICSRELRLERGDHRALLVGHAGRARRTQHERVPDGLDRLLLGEPIQTQAADEAERADEVGPDVDADRGRGNGEVRVLIALEMRAAGVRCKRGRCGEEVCKLRHSPASGRGESRSGG